jgi:hypothetical protein
VLPFDVGFGEANDRTLAFPQVMGGEFYVGPVVEYFQAIDVLIIKPRRGCLINGEREWVAPVGRV